jgi:hypothetical protein
MANVVDIDGLGAFDRGRMETGSIGLAVVSPYAAMDAGSHCQSLAHDRTPASEHLEIAHAATTSRSIVRRRGRRRQRAESGGRRLCQKRADSSRLTKESLHSRGSWFYFSFMAFFSTESSNWAERSLVGRWKKRSWLHGPRKWGSEIVGKNLGGRGFLEIAALELANSIGKGPLLVSG